MRSVNKARFVKNLFMKALLSLLILTIGIQVNAQVSHKQWDELVNKHVSKSGNVNYKGFIQDKDHLDAYLNLLSNNPPKDTWTKNETLAYWINAYNAFTVKLIVKHYPVKSIKDLGGPIYRVNTSWDIKFIKIGTEELDLNNIEHQKIRGQFNEPRIHFAVNCASVSCPKLLNEAYSANQLDAQLTRQTKLFLSDKTKNDLSNPNQPKLSKLFDWYKGDFTKNGVSLSDFINKYSDIKISKSASIGYLEYNWNLNE